MAVAYVILLIGVAGLVGGLVNAFLAEEGFVLWRREVLADGRRIWRPGFLGNVMVGAVAAIVLAALYSPLGSVDVGVGATVQNYHLTLAALAGAVLSGVGGARLLTQEVGRRYDQLTREQMASAIRQLASATVSNPPRDPDAD